VTGWPQRLCHVVLCQHSWLGSTAIRDPGHKVGWVLVENTCVTSKHCVYPTQEAVRWWLVGTSAFVTGVCLNRGLQGELERLDFAPILFAWMALHCSQVCQALKW
jgi:hypothetical protein